MEFNGRERDREGRSNGDTYHLYSRRCRIAGIEPASFVEWLRFELAFSRPAGRHLYLDEHQRVEAMQLQA